MVKCFLCKNDFVVLLKEEEKCYNKSKYLNDTKFVFINNTHVDFCENVIPNCVECENMKKCKTCKEGYYFNIYDNICVFKDNVTKNYPPYKEEDETDKPRIENNSIFFIINILKIQIIFLIFIL